MSSDGTSLPSDPSDDVFSQDYCGQIPDLPRDVVQIDGAGAVRESEQLCTDYNNYAAVPLQDAWQFRSQDVAESYEVDRQRYSYDGYRAESADDAEVENRPSSPSTGPGVGMQVWKNDGQQTANEYGVSVFSPPSYHEAGQSYNDMGPECPANQINDMNQEEEEEEEEEEIDEQEIGDENLPDFDAPVEPHTATNGLQAKKVSWASLDRQTRGKSMHFKKKRRRAARRESMYNPRGSKSRPSSSASTDIVKKRVSFATDRVLPRRKSRSSSSSSSSTVSTTSRETDSSSALTSPGSDAYDSATVSFFWKLRKLCFGSRKTKTKKQKRKTKEKK